ncbi:MAG: YqgE/AlgH family protein [Planctomycetes bacterium]|nr:YqgE/AlgH family protein [Planctomycetota bacterium]
MEIDVGKGSILIANPHGTDQNFMETVVLICEHSKKGAFGLIVNKTLGKKGQEIIIPSLDAQANDKELFFGGPVDTNKMYYLHGNYKNEAHDCEKICEGVYLGSNQKCLNEFISRRNVSDDIFRLYLGCAGWSGGQLEYEIEMKCWTVGTATENIVFYPYPDKIWWNILRSISNIDPEFPCDSAEPILN